MPDFVAPNGTTYRVERHDGGTVLLTGPRGAVWGLIPIKGTDQFWACNARRPGSGHGLGGSYRFRIEGDRVVLA